MNCSQNAFLDAKLIALRNSRFSHNSWIRETQQTSDISIIISEILDSKTRNLVSVYRINDYVLSNEFVSMTLVMVSEDKKINRVLEELFAEEVCTYCQFLIFPMVCFCHEICVRTNIGSS